jgi:glutathione S-transferase
MKLYYATGTCSLWPHIVALESGVSLDLEKVDIGRTPRVTESGASYAAVNPNGYVPALELDDGTVLIEGVAIAQYLTDLAPEAGLAPAGRTPERYRLLSWLNFVATELHKSYSPWLFHPEYGRQAQDVARKRIADRLGFVESQLAAGGPHLLGEKFTAADAYLFTIVSWSAFTGVSLTAFPRLRAFMESVGARPRVREAMQAQGMKLAA